MSDEEDWQTSVRRPEIERRRREDERARCIERFIERQCARRWWIPFFDIVDAHGLSAGPTGSPSYNQTREAALCLLSQSILDGEFERAGQSRVLYLPADLSADGAPPKRWLKREAYRIARDAAAPLLPFDVLGCCWMSQRLAQQWLTVQGSRSPAQLVADTPSGAAANEQPRPDRAPKSRKGQSASASALPRPTVRDADLRAWYAKWVETNEEAYEQTSEADDWEEAQRVFGDKARREQVRDLRRKLAPAAWRKQGRRRKAAE